MQWKHILDEQPEHGRRIVQVNPPYEGNYSIGTREYYQKCTFQELLDYYKSNGDYLPDFWWIYEKDFPFPKKKINIGES